MEKFNEALYLQDMYGDDYFPEFLVDKVRDLFADAVKFLETGERDVDAIQAKFDKIVNEINKLQQEFWDNGSDIETGARDSIAETVDHILAHFKIADCDRVLRDKLLRDRDW